MYEDNIFESHEFEAKADFEMDWEDLLEELRDYEIPEERLSELAAQDGGFPFLELNFQELRYLNLMDEQLYVGENESAEFYTSMANTYGTRGIDGIEYALMDDFAYHYFHEMMTVEAVDRQGRQFVMIYGMPDNWEEIERQVEEKVWDPSEEDEVAAAEGTKMWAHPDMVISMIDFRNEIINRAAFELRKNGVPLELNFLSKRMFIDDVLVSRAITLQMPGIIAAFEKISENFSDVDHLAFSMDDKRAHIFYADMDETIDHMLTTCGRIANRSGKRSGIGEVFYDTFLDRVERALFELIFLVNKPTDELAFVSGVAMQRLDSIRAGEMELGELTLDEINRLMHSFPELLNLDWLFS
ncbi:hypothetical protein [uncultured Trichococcus sp.]|uniref:hypothetical protein n=1 Tax=uncultured Trichococcus sp. TaxID=189665 RepID=UPI002A186DE2|nr:hypothetical protein [uncultured Trichococcus sp.]